MSQSHLSGNAKFFFFLFLFNSITWNGAPEQVKTIIVTF